MSLQILDENLERLRDRIGNSALRAGRRPEAITLVAVTKRTPHQWARHLASTGQFHLGENYPQELWAKADSLNDIADIRWHAIGHLQSNKLKRTVPLVTMIHAIDSLKLLVELTKHLSPEGSLKKICLQVNLSMEESKHGWSKESIRADATKIAELIRRTQLPVTGLMTMAPLGTDSESARPTFAELRKLSEELRTSEGLPLSDLSMGMSGDFEAAIAEGATHVRIGSLLFDGMATTS